VNYEFRIQLLEKDLAHYREMQALVRERLDTVNRFAKQANERLDRIEAALEKLVEAQTHTQQILAAFIESLRKDNGRQS
jgi:hypothetical protein